MDGGDGYTWRMARGRVYFLGTPGVRVGVDRKTQPWLRIETNFFRFYICKCSRSNLSGECDLHLLVSSHYTLIKMNKQI